MCINKNCECACVCLHDIKSFEFEYPVRIRILPQSSEYPNYSNIRFSPKNTLNRCKQYISKLGLHLGSKGVFTSLENRLTHLIMLFIFLLTIDLKPLQYALAYFLNATLSKQVNILISKNRE